MILGLIPLGFAPSITLAYFAAMLIGIGLGGLVLIGDAIMTEVVEKDKIKTGHQWTGKQLGQRVCCVVRQLPLELEKFDVILISSLFEGHPLMQESMGETIYRLAPDARLVRLNVPPVVGGVVLAMQADGLDTRPIRENLITSMAERTREV